MPNYVTFQQLRSLFQEIGYKFGRIGTNYVSKGNSTFANLPTPSAETAGYVYNVTDDFTTTANFVEGAGKDYPAGTNVLIADVTPVTYAPVDSPEAGANPKYNGWYERDATATDTYFLTADDTLAAGKIYHIGTRGTPAYKYDVLGNFVDVEGINDNIDKILADIAPEFDATASYTKGDLVIHEGTLYKFEGAIDNTISGSWTYVTDPSAGGTVVSEVSIAEVLDLYCKKENVSGLFDKFSTSNTYEPGELVWYDAPSTYSYNTGLWVAQQRHTAGAFDTTEFAKITLSTLYESFRQTFAVPYDSSRNYKAGEYAWFGRRLYYFIKEWYSTDTALDAVAPDTTYVRAAEGHDNGTLNYLRDTFLSTLTNINYFTRGVSYSGGQYVVHDNAIYKCLTGYTPNATNQGLWVDSEFRKVTITELINDKAGYAQNLAQYAINSLAPQFDPTETYEVGDIVWYPTNVGSSIYKCTTAHTGSWDPTHFTSTTLADLIEAAEPEGLTTAQMNELLGLL